LQGPFYEKNSANNKMGNCTSQPDQPLSAAQYAELLAVDDDFDIGDVPIEKRDPEFFAEIVRRDPANLALLPHMRFFSKKYNAATNQTEHAELFRVVVAEINKNWTLLGCIPQNLMRSELIEIGMRQNPEALRFASFEAYPELFKRYPEKIVKLEKFTAQDMIKFINYNPSFFKHVANRYRHRRDSCCGANASITMSAFQSTTVPPLTSASPIPREVLVHAINQTPLNLQAIPSELQDEELCMMAIEFEPRMLQHVANQTPDLCLAAIKLRAATMQYVRDQNEEFCIRAVTVNPDALAFVKEQTPKMCSHAVYIDPAAIRLVRAQTQKLRDYALRLDPSVARFFRSSSRPHEGERSNSRGLTSSETSRHLKSIQDQLLDEFTSLPVSMQSFLSNNFTTDGSEVVCAASPITA
jgi:hypothetical protein